MARHACGDIQASATITNSQGYYYPYHYDITLQNTGDTPIATFWFAWDDSGLNFLPSYPYPISSPSGWYPYLTDNYGVSSVPGYGVEWYAYGTPMAPGDSLMFSFESYDSPSVINNISSVPPVRPGDSPFPVTTSFVYQQFPAQQANDPGFQFVVSPPAPPAPVPEPASLALLVTSAVLLLMRRPNSITPNSY